MTITLAQYLANAEVRDANVASLEHCKVCKVSLQEAIHGYRKVEDGAYCSDCYFNEMGDFIDTHPIGRPMGSVLTVK